MALVIVASALPMAVQCTSTAEPGMEPAYSVDLVGERDPAAIHGVGLTYDVDDVAFNEWIALNVELAPNVRIVTQAEIDSWSYVNNKYGYELGLEVDSGGTLAAGGLGAVDLTGDLERSRTAALRRRMAETSLRQAEMNRDAAEVALETAKAEREIAEAVAREATEATQAAQEAIRQPPPPAPKPAPRQEPQPRHDA
jgi:regulator of protease activity HflC (stomatin/prohibitin superfamily)